MNPSFRIAAVASLILGTASPAFSEPEAAKPVTSASPAPSAAATATPSPAKTPEPTPTPAALSPARAVDSLSDAEAQQALELLRSTYIRSGALNEAALNRATLQGLLERIGGGAAIRPTGGETATENPFRSEILDEQIGYVRLGSLSKGHLAEFDAALGNFNSKKVGSLILDLRATPPSNDFDLASDVIKRLTPKGKMLFAVHRPSAKQERMFTSDLDPAFKGNVVTLVGRDTAGAPEVIAAVLRAVDNALVVGHRTAGQAAEYSELPLKGGKALRVAVAEVKLPPQVTVFPEGLKPDLSVQVSARDERDALQTGLDKGVAGLVYETERARINEAALVAGTNPELDADEEDQRRGKNDEEDAPPCDVVLQRAVDLVTTLRIFGGKTP
ncbi:MAG: S41 family peptidase [Chthoniobacteraceae bacterium]